VGKEATVTYLKGGSQPVTRATEENHASPQGMHRWGWVSPGASDRIACVLTMWLQHAVATVVTAVLKSGSNLLPGHVVLSHDP